MYLVVGSERDSCVSAVRAALERKGQRVITTRNPFGSSGRLRWLFDSRTSSLACSFDPNDSDRGGALEGVFVRSFSALQDPSGWDPEDAGYLHNEGMAAVLAWLHVLECPVVGRPSDDVWYRPQRPEAEWVGLLAACGLATPTVVVTNAPEAQAVVTSWANPAIYQPLTSGRTYVVDRSAWPELAKVMAFVPVSLSERREGAIGTVTFVGDRLFWTHPPQRDRDRLESGVRRLAGRLQIDFAQVHYRRTADGPEFRTVAVQPTLDLHESVDRQRIVDEIVARLLGSDRPEIVPSSQPEREARS